MREIGLRHDEATARAFVESMHDAGAFDAANPSELAATMMKQSVDQRVLAVTSGGMYHEAGRFVDNDEVVVLEQNLQRDGLGLYVERSRGRDFDADAVANAHFVARLGGTCVDGDVAVGGQPLEKGTRMLRELRTQKLVKALAALRFGYAERRHNFNPTSAVTIITTAIKCAMVKAPK